MADNVIITTDVKIARPPEVVWPYLVDWERLGRWMREARGFRVIGSQREGVGVQAEATVRVAGITTRDLVRVSRWEPPTVLEITHGGWVKGRGLMELSPTDRASHVSWREELEPPWGLLGRLGLRTFAPLMRRIFQRDLFLLRELVEEETSVSRGA